MARLGKIAGSTRWSWALLSAAIALLVAIPLIYVFSGFFSESEVWQHLKETVLTSYIFNTLALVVLTVLLSACWGIGLAWITSRYRFPGYRFFSWILVIPLAIPTYIMAYAYQGIFSFTGPVYDWLQYLGYTGGPIDIMHIPGLAFLLSWVLYPYIYLACRVVFSGAYSDLLEAGKSLGASERRLFWKIMFPLAKGAIAAGGFLVAMEVLNDYGAMKYFGIPTFTLGLFSAWLDMSDLQAALKLASYLVLVVFTLVLVERWLRRGSVESSGKTSIQVKLALHGKRGWWLTLLCTAFLSVAFLFPIAHLISDALHEVFGQWFDDLWLWIANSIMLGSLSAILIVCGALILVFNEKVQLGKLPGLINKVSTIGYVIPGAVIALGMMQVGYGLFSQASNFGFSPSLYIKGVVLLLAAYFVRFLAIGMSTTSSSVDEVGKDLHQASMGLGRKSWTTFFKITVPLSKKGILAAALLVFVDVVKELPLTLILRPFNFYTLATKTFEYADDEMLGRAALPALCIIALGAIPMYLTHKLGTPKEK